MSETNQTLCEWSFQDKHKFSVNALKEKVVVVWAEVLARIFYCRYIFLVCACVLHVVITV